MKENPKDTTNIKSNIIEELTRFYQKYNPENTHNIKEILEKYSGKETSLCAKLQKKYGDHPKILPSTHDEKKSIKEKPTSKCTTFISIPNFKPYTIPPSPGGPLDYHSKDFDPLIALQNKYLPNAMTNVVALDNLFKAKVLLPENDPNADRRIQLGRINVKNTTKATKESTKNSSLEPPPGVLHDLADTYITGPFSVLRDCFLHRKRVCVLIRRINSIRGECCGYLKAFDKHMNLVLNDVTESFLPYQIHFTNASYSVGNAKHQQDRVQKRYLKQLLIRGDNIVLIFPINKSHKKF